MLPRVLVMVLLALVWCGEPARAQNPLAGSYKASNGVTVMIPDSQGQFKMVWVAHDGKKVDFVAHWTVPGKEFEWIDKQNSRHTARVDPKRPNVIRDVGEAYPDSPAYWYRLK